MIKPKRKPRPKATIPLPTNTLFPGRGNYTGPQTGYFGLLHHEQLYEECGRDYQVRTRVDYVAYNKPINERAVRLHNMIYLGDCPIVKLIADLKAVFLAASNHYPYEVSRSIEQAWDSTKRHARPYILAYIRKHIPDCPWDEQQNTLFPNKTFVS